MEGGNIIKFPGESPDDRNERHAKRVIKKMAEGPRNKLAGSFEKSRQEKEAFLAAWSALVSIGTAKIAQITEYLDNLGRPLDQAKVAAQEKIFLGLSDREVVEMLKESVEQDWNRKPEYYKAMANAFAKKMSRP